MADTGDGLAADGQGAGRVVVERGERLRLSPLGLSFGHMGFYAWDDLVLVEPTDPWPNLRVRGKVGDGVLDHELTGGDGFAEVVADVVARVRAALPRVVRDGWLSFPEVMWTRVASLPGGKGAQHAGGYRGRAEETVICQREPASGALRLLESRSAGVAIAAGAALATAPLLATHPWILAIDAALGIAGMAGVHYWPDLSSSPFRIDGRVALTPDNVYQSKGRAVYRIPLGILRAAVLLREPAGHIDYYFGRRAVLRLSVREDCPVQRALEAHLARAETSDEEDRS